MRTVMVAEEENEKTEPVDWEIDVQVFVFLKTVVIFVIRPQQPPRKQQSGFRGIVLKAALILRERSCRGVFSLHSQQRPV